MKNPNIRLISVLAAFFTHKVSVREFIEVLTRVAENKATEGDKERYISFIQDLFKCV